MSIEKIYTISEMIIMGRMNPYINKDYCKLIKIGDSILTVSGNILDKYITFIDAIKVKVVLSSEEFLRYKYNPKQLCLDLYNTEELAPLILKLNNISHESDFTRKKIYVLNPANTSTLLNKIISINEDSIKKNQAEL